MLWVVGIVVRSIHRAILLETLYEHPLAVGIGKAHRTHHLGHSALASPLFYCLQECPRHFNVVNEVEPSETHRLMVPALIGNAVDDCSHASYSLPVPVSHEVLSVTVVKRRILVLTQRKHLVAIEVRHVVRVVPIKVIAELYKLLKSFFSFYFTYFYIFHGRLLV